MLTYINFPFESFGRNNESKDTVIVSTAEEFINAIASNRTIKLTSDTFLMRDIEQLSSIPLDYSGKQISLTKNVIYLPGNGITILSVSNFEIIGVANTTQQSILSTRDKGDIVLTFRECENIKLENIEANHIPKTNGGCQGGVIFFDRCKNINMNNCILIGSGRNGIQCNDVNNLSCTKTTIKECSSSIFEFNRSSNLNFTDCEFKNIRCTGFLVISTNCNSFNFTNCMFSDNYCDTTDEYYKEEIDFIFYFYNDTRSMSFVVDNCTFSNNRIKWFSNKNNIFTKTNINYLNNDNLK